MNELSCVDVLVQTLDAVYKEIGGFHIESRPRAMCILFVSGFIGFPDYTFRTTPKRKFPGGYGTRSRNVHRPGGSQHHVHCLQQFTGFNPLQAGVRVITGAEHGAVAVPNWNPHCGTGIGPEP